MEYVIVDVEGTLSAGSMWHAIGRYLSLNGQGSAYRWLVTRTLPGIAAMRLGLIDRQTYKNRWLEMQAALLAGSYPIDIHRLAEWVVEEELWPLRRPEVISELESHHAQGRTVLLASGMYDTVLQSLSRKLDTGTVAVVGTPLSYRHGRFTGRFAGPVCVGTEKARRATELIEATAATGDRAPTIEAAYGDTGSDIPMLELAHHPVAVAPDRELTRVASERGWRMLCV
ncbi:MAG: HAD-IB family phosphatase [Actinobacteria bacterium]|nr:HAD-IB family phosphatase [Actinomycetota bacterium]